MTRRVLLEQLDEAGHEKEGLSTRQKPLMQQKVIYLMCWSVSLTVLLSL